MQLGVASFQLAGRAPQLLDQLRVAQGDGGVPGQRREQLHVMVGEASWSAVRGQQDADRLPAELQREPEDAAELLAARHRVDVRHPADPRVIQIRLGPHRATGAQHLSADALARAQRDTAERRAHGPVCDLDPQTLGMSQHQVGDVGVEQSAGLGGDFLEHLAGVVHRAQPAGEIVEHGELAGLATPCGQQLPDPTGRGCLVLDPVAVRRHEVRVGQEPGPVGTQLLGRSVGRQEVQPRGRTLGHRLLRPG
jgi:hypothetical protein